MTRRNFVLAVSVVMAGAMLAATAPVGAAPAAPITGTIVSATPDTIVLNTAQGNKTIKTTAKTTVIEQSPAKLSDIKKGEWLGVDAKKSATGTLTAVSIHIFPAQSTGKFRTGQWTMTSGDTMTNAQVTQAVSQVSGNTISLAYEGGMAKILVPSSAKIYRLVRSSVTALKPQMHAMVRGQPNADGTVTAAAITVETMTAMH